MNRIRAIRDERAKVVPSAFTAVAIARRVGVSDRTLWAWEQGINKPRRRHARALARELGVTVEELGLDDDGGLASHEAESTSKAADQASARPAALPTAKNAEAGESPHDARSA